KKDFNTNTNEVVTSDVNGFDAYRTYSANASMGTTIYGMFNFGKDKKVQVIRHVLRPTVSYTYTPSFEKYYDTYASDASGTMQKYSRFDQGIFGAPNLTNYNIMGMSLNNVFEAKVRDKDKTKTEPKKVMLLNNLNLSTSYNFTADSL